MENQAQYVYHAADTRGHADHGWLDTYHSFSFASWHNPERMHFGALRVLNDDFIGAGAGFNTHPHDNMEIVTIPLEGDLEHQDSMGNTSVIRHGEVQTRPPEQVFALEKTPTPPVKACCKSGCSRTPGTSSPATTNKPLTQAPNATALTVVSPDGADGAQIHQNAWFNLGSWDAGHKESYALHGDDQGVYAFVLEGSVTIDGRTLGRRDGLGVWNTSSIEIAASEDARILLMEVPMHW